MPRARPVDNKQSYWQHAFPHGSPQPGGEAMLSFDRLHRSPEVATRATNEMSHHTEMHPGRTKLCETPKFGCRPDS